MQTAPVKIKDGIVLFSGKLSRHLMLEPIVSNAYFLEDGDEIILFDPSCGKNIARRIESHMQDRRRSGAAWKKAYLIAGHSHIDHANNFYLADLTGAEKTHIYVHEAGFNKNGTVMNEPAAFITNKFEEYKKYYNPYLSFSFPNNLLMVPFAALDVFFPKLTAKLFGRIGALPWDLGNTKIKGWRLGDKIILYTPGHSPCSVSLFWPEKKALLISDADWIGNPVFLSSSIKDSIDSMEKIKTLAGSGKIDLFLPAHGPVRQGENRIIEHLDFLIRRLKAMRTDILSAYESCGRTKDVRKLTKFLVREYPVFRALKLLNYPRLVVFVHNIVAVCLKEEGIIDDRGFFGGSGVAGK